MQFNCKCVNSICGWQDMCQLQKGKLIKCEQQMCSCKSVELLMFQWHMNKTANVVTAKYFNCLCIQLQMCYQQMYDLQMKNCICSSGQCRFTRIRTVRARSSEIISSHHLRSSADADHQKCAKVRWCVASVCEYLSPYPQVILSDFV